MSKDRHLTKDQELELGRRITEMKKSREIISSNTSLKEEEKSVHNATIIEGEAAKARLVEAYTGMVHGKAIGFKNKYPGAPDLEDLVQEGMVGLVKGIDHYDYTRGNKVSTVVTHWIFQNITRETNKTGRLVKLPENRVTDFSRISKLRNELDELGYSKSEADDKIMEDLKLSRDDLWFITNAAATHASLNKVISSDESSTRELIDLVTDDHAAESAEASVMKGAVYSILSDCFEVLTVQERDIVASTFMLDGYPAGSMKPKEIQAQYGLNPAKFKKILNEALNTIKAELDKVGMTFEDFLTP